MPLTLAERCGSMDLAEEFPRSSAEARIPPVAQNAPHPSSTG
jgi:hypothetical protein